MADLTSNFLGIKSPNPFWLASAPPTDKAYNVNRAFEAGWGGVSWKTLGEDPHIVNVNGPRYSTMMSNDRRVIGFNNIELITDRPFQVNLKEMRQVKRDWPDRALVASVMFPMNEESWAKHIPIIEDTGIDGFELNFGCPHGMSERGMGAAVGQVPEYIKQATEWCKKYATVPVIVKLTPNITDVIYPAEACLEGGADAVSLINTINSIMRVDYDSLTMFPTTGGMGTHGGYCGEAVKPIALNMVAEIARNEKTKNLPISGIGGVTTWKDAVDFIALGASNVQVCTAAMVYGFKIVEDMKTGLSNFLDEKGMIDQHKVDLVSRMGGNWYCRADKNSMFEIQKPITTLGVGIDKIPTEIKESKILSGNDLGQLGGVENLPDETEVNEYKLLELSDLFISLEDNPNKLEE